MAGGDKIWVNMRRSASVRQPGGGTGQSYGPGLVQVPRSFAQSLNLQEVEGPKAKSAKTEDKYANFSKADFVAEADLRGLDVKRSEGEGEPRVAEYRAALEADDAAKA